MFRMSWKVWDVELKERESALSREMRLAQGLLFLSFDFDGDEKL